MSKRRETYSEKQAREARQARDWAKNTVKVLEAEAEIFRQVMRVMEETRTDGGRALSENDPFR